MAPHAGATLAAHRAGCAGHRIQAILPTADWRGHGGNGNGRLPPNSKVAPALSPNPAQSTVRCLFQLAMAPTKPNLVPLSYPLSITSASINA